MSDAKDDIVDRLRWAVENDPLVPEVGYDEEFTEAADEIVRLRGLVAGYEKAAANANKNVGAHPRLASPTLHD